MQSCKMSWEAARGNAGLTQEDVVKAIHVSKSTIINWEKYRSYPTILQAYQLCDLYGISIDVIDAYRQG